VLAEQGRLSVRAVAQMLGIPVRTAQHALKALAEEGICEVERRGRELQYRIEDTTFSEPTRTTQDV
jgi:predicted transcriptional regulator